ncbi:phospholipase D family protein (plasmid) [Acinetobacter indicus]|uniref:phospholipase D family protein n=1 Tax=Acinetobacter indicus TaxID=756892 RepID=UPI001FA7F52E|nr:phospholipase D family protein [Acinetobacter indicus]UNW11166.1 phospholipase D family protein [Acinetobacter indicus]
MAKFLNTSATNFYLEELIKNAKERVILISPFLKINDRIKELLEDKNRLKIDVRLVYGKTELQPKMSDWLRTQDYVRLSYCKNLHAKCYINEESCIITSLNLYEFSQVNNNEMGVLITKEDDSQLFKDTYAECQRIIRVSDEVRITIEKTSDNQVDLGSGDNEIEKSEVVQSEIEKSDNSEKITSSVLSKKLGLRNTTELHDKLVEAGCMTKNDNNKYFLTEKAKFKSAEAKRGQYGFYFLWPADFTP